MSTFHGLEMAKQALFTQQTALYTTGHNIANSNTKGYTRQRVNFETQGAYPSPGLNRPQMPGQIGTGVKAGTIERIRDKFLDQQYRTEHTKAGYWQTTSEALGRMESILNEPSDSGLAKTFDKFWDSLQDLANNPDNSGARSVVARRDKL
ncbi:flagellar basal body protein [Virgibacillus soli]|uniref:Flagellar hook-associated protein 1 n=1 Tax=Paracerasibacillus soli TaxID=480284 RepID=A0ABU5CRB7_9BACI|nr:flagellar basal body protein [Virgibacillus soli]MDY0408918.1 flagellar basal body protein [Virgibacillus soli]